MSCAIRIPSDQAEVNEHFERLGEALKGVGLPADERFTQYREAYPEEFMLMHVSDGRSWFKHRGTRMYLSLCDSDNKVVTHGYYGKEAYL
jgi:hypothetical protein